MFCHVTNGRALHTLPWPIATAARDALKVGKEPKTFTGTMPLHLQVDITQRGGTNDGV